VKADTEGVLSVKSNKSSLRIFNGAVAIVTGAASGIGRALAEELSRRGSEVILADLQCELAQEVASGICSAGGKATVKEVDVTDFSAIETLVRETVDRTGRLDYMFNNAGIGIGGEVWRYCIEDWDRIIDVNLRGVTYGVQAAYQVMFKQGFGHIVNTSSAAGLAPFPFEVGYVATKYAVVGLSTALRMESIPTGIRVSVICPGVIRTPILKGGKYGRMLMNIPQDNMEQAFERFRPMPPATFARKALDGVAKNKAIIIVPAWWKTFWWLNRFSSSLWIHLMQKSFEKTQKELRKIEK
jgi:NAD(P)-dependent dehydrogenase (short-subunit alcohol dehydrogenase family)